MRIFVAGGSGAIGIPLVRSLVKAKHEVMALTKSPEKQQMIRNLGAKPVVADALDGAALHTMVEAAHPTHVIHELTAIPSGGVRKASELAATNRLRIEGTRNLLSAAIAAGAARIVVGSFAPMQGVGRDVPQDVQDSVAAVRSMESQTLEVSRSGRIEGIVLRYGLFYGRGNPATEKMISLVRRRMLPVVHGDHSLLPWINIADAVSATVAALDHGQPGGVYDIVDDKPMSMTEVVQAIAEYAGARPPRTVPHWLMRLSAPYLAMMVGMYLPLLNQKARTELAWHPLFPTWRDGLA
jgi:nucleoside-diphosphate-sugar epimerase